MSEARNARVVAEHKTKYVIRDGITEFSAAVRGSFHAEGGYPKVGDFVEYAETVEGQAVIESILPRRTSIVRDVSERTRRNAVQKPQVIVANVDVIFIVMGLDGDFNVRRLERYFSLAKQSGIRSVVILNKTDAVLPEDLRSRIEEVSAAAPEGTSIHPVSALSGKGMDAFSGYFSEEKALTAVLLGSSGAGKSTITNWLLGHERQATGKIREDDSRGKHTTTSRELFDLPGGGHLIDTPGMRGLGLMADDKAKDDIFADVEALASGCRFSDCDHEKSEGCAIEEAVRSGDIDPGRYQGYMKLRNEKEYQEAKADTAAYAERKQKVRKIHKQYGKIQDQKYKQRGFR